VQSFEKYSAIGAFAGAAAGAGLCYCAKNFLG